MKLLDYLFCCHKLPERSFFFRNKQFPICARCTGIMIGYIIGIISVIFNFRFYYLFPLLYIPIFIDGVGQSLGKWVSNNSRRVITGTLAGIATIWLFNTIVISASTYGKLVGNKIKENFF